jgi:hypothetical protein
VRAFFSIDEVERINDFVRGHGHGRRQNVTVFFRGQLLELLRWVALLSHDHDDDGNTFEDGSVRRAFARAALLASDVWARRVYPDEFNLDGGVEKARLRVLAGVRQSNVGTAAGPHPFFALARGMSFYAETLRTSLPEAETTFEKRTGLGMDDYFSIVAYLAVLGLDKSVLDLKNPDKSGLLPIDALTQTDGPSGALSQRYFSLESQGPDELRLSLWGNRTDSDEQDAGPYDLKPLRAKPILRVARGRAIVLDPTVFIERATAGPLFYLVDAEPERANRWFSAFGNAFEAYVQEIMGRMFPDGAHLVRRYIPNPVGLDGRGNEVELADGILLGHHVAVFLEMKAVWLREKTSQPTTSPSEYIGHLRERYGVTESKQPGEGRVKGVGQLARTINRLASGEWRARDFDPASVRRILPVLLVHDAHIGAALHPHFLAQEFCAALTSANAPADWREIAKGGFQVAHLSVLTVDDIEMLETSIEYFALLDCLEDYAAASPDRLTSFYNFLLGSRFREKLRYSRSLLSKRDQMLDAMIARLFPDAIKGTAST